jgi:hypothetical protein
VRNTLQAASVVRSRFARRLVAPERRCKRKRYAYGSRTVPDLRCKVAGRVEYRGVSITYYLLLLTEGMMPGFP